MGTLANTLFQVMLGWIRSLSAEIWNTVSSPEGSTFFAWVGKHWIVLTVILCLLGLAADLIVYLFRWQPYRVWRSFFRRMQHSGEEPEDEPEPGDEPEPEEETGTGRRRAFFRRERDEADDGDEEEPEETPLPETKPREPEWYRNEPEGTTPIFEQAILPGKRRRVTKLFKEANEENLPGPEQLIDQYAAYRRPVYPRSWKAEEKDEEDRE